MIYLVLANALALLHFAFVVFVVLGGVFVLRWPKLAWIHLPAAAWGAAIEFGGWVCPLTKWENYFLRAAGKAGYDEGFLAHYIFALLYPNGLTRAWEIAIGLFVLVVNVSVYAKVIR